MGVMMELVLVAKLKKDGGDGSSLGQNASIDIGRDAKSLSSLGLHQKDSKKGVGEKSSKPGRKKDLEKIKLIGENLVESGSVKTLDSHFSNPSK